MICAEKFLYVRKNYDISGNFFLYVRENYDILGNFSYVQKIFCDVPNPPPPPPRQQYWEKYELAISQSPGSSRTNPLLEGQEIRQHTFKLKI